MLSQPGAGPARPAAVAGAWHALLARIDGSLRELAAHPARSVVLLPYQQLLPLARQLWAERFPEGFAPCFETTRSWAERLDGFVPAASDLTFDHGRDLLTAASLLEGAGLGARRGLAGALVQQASQLAQVAASLPAALRPDWAEQARAALPPPGDGPLGLEGALGRIAVAWAAASDYATDVLFAPRVGRLLDALFIVPGLQRDALTDHLAEHYVEQAVRLPPLEGGAPGALALHQCESGEDEAERAAACVLRHLSARRVPVALAAGDRLLTRRISALLAARGVRLRDETGWKLSTTHAAAQVMALLRAGARGSSADAVLGWLKLAPAVDARALRALEQRLRKRAVRGWAQAAALAAGDPLTVQAQAWRAELQAPRRLPDWLQALRDLLAATGMWPALQQDPAGIAVIGALGLAPASDAGWRQWPPAQRRLGLGEFTGWAGQALEAASFRPPPAPDAQVVVLPLSQLLGRPFAALVLPGADAGHMPAAAEPAGPWTERQRQALRLPTRAELHAEQQAAWRVARAQPHVDVLWRRSDEGGEAVLPSPFVQALQLGGEGADGIDPRVARERPLMPVALPAPSGALLPAQPLSASGYDMLRACPYRFFALRQLGLSEDGELDVDVEKRDFGNWLHDVLRRFHEALQRNPASDRVALIDAAADRATHESGLDEAEFLPFTSAWPQLRDAYLGWLGKHEADGAVFVQAEADFDVRRGELQLKGRIDRIDAAAGGTQWLIDYKTESRERTGKRLKAPGEDTQLPFYALLAGADAPRAMYLSLAEREEPKPYVLANVPEQAAQLYEGIVADLKRVAAGAPLRALGEGSVCDWCAARGLCRKDFWTP